MVHILLWGGAGQGILGGIVLLCSKGVQNLGGFGLLNLRNLKGLEFDVCRCRCCCSGLLSNVLLLCDSIDLSFLWFL